MPEVKEKEMKLKKLNKYIKKRPNGVVIEYVYHRPDRNLKDNDGVWKPFWPLEGNKIVGAFRVQKVLLLQLEDNEKRTRYMKMELMAVRVLSSVCMPG
jgi:hypothetical protein